MRQKYFVLCIVIIALFFLSYFAGHQYISAKNLFRNRATSATSTLGGFLSDMTGAYIYDQYLGYHNFTGFNFSNASLNSVTMIGSVLVGANLSGAKILLSTLTSADLSKANLLGTNFSGSNLTDADLTGAKIDGTTIWYSCTDSICYPTTCPDGKIIPTDISTCIGHF
jgi:hypothetical protein